MMIILLQIITRAYASLLRFYPRRFREEFSSEMQAAFDDLAQEASKAGPFALLVVFLRELIDLPASLSREFWHEFERKETLMVTNEKTDAQMAANGRAGYRDAFWGSLPFALFGIAMMVGKSRLPFYGVYLEIAFSILVLSGLSIGLALGFPRWAYSYLGWSMVMSWWWMMMPIDTFVRSAPPYTHNQLLGWWSWLPLVIPIGIGLLFARSLRPIRHTLLGIWQDWTLASFMIYTFVAFVSLIYDENHHPYLFLFMTASTIILSTSAWLFLQSDNMRKRIVSLLSGFILAFTVMYTCDATWDWHAYYGYPKPPAEDEYMTFLRIGIFIVVYGVILFLPALLGLARRSVKGLRIT